MISIPAIIDDRYKVGIEIGTGSFAHIYEGTELVTEEKIAIKLENSLRKPQLPREGRIFRVLRGGFGIPELKWAGMENGYHILVMDLLGKSLEDLMCEKSRSYFSLKTSLMLVDQIICRLEYLHNMDYILRDVKPGNFLMSRDLSDKTVYMIDYGLAKKYRDAQTLEHIPAREGRGITGTIRYVSINCGAGIEQSRRDDLESLGYSMLYFIKGSLPWQGLKIKNRRAKYSAICEMKATIPLEKLASGCPVEVRQYMEYVQGLAFDAQPDYYYLRKLLRSVFVKNRFQLDYSYDWNVVCGSPVDGTSSFMETSPIPCTDATFELPNGLTDMGRDVFMHLFAVIAVRSQADCETKDQNIASVMGMCQEYWPWKSHTFFTNVRARFSYIPASLHAHRLSECTVTPSGKQCIFHTGSVFLNCQITEGIFQWNVRVNYHGGESSVDLVEIGAAPCHLVHPARRLGGDRSCGVCFLQCRPNSSTLCMADKERVFCEEMPVCDGSLVSLEIDCSASTLSFFVNRKKVPCVVAGIIPPLFLAASGNDGHTLTSLSLRRVGSPTLSAVVCRMYAYDPVTQLDTP